MIDSLVQEMLDTTYPEDPIHQCLAHFGSDFDIDSSISEVNALLDSTPLLDTSTWVPPFDPLLIDTHLSVDNPVNPCPDILPNFISATESQIDITPSLLLLT